MVHIRQATAADLESLLDLWEEFTCYLEKLEPDFFRLKPGARNIYREMLKERLGESGNMILVADDEGVLVGYHTVSIRYPGAVFVQNPYGHISDLYLRTNYRNNNLGVQMIEMGVRWLRERGITHLDVKTFTTNHHGQQFWERQGFESYELAFKCALEKN